jgi:hypothetical protein
MGYTGIRSQKKRKITVWVKLVTDQAKPGLLIYESVAKLTYECATRMYVLHQISNYDLKGGVVGNGTEKFAGVESEIIPGTVGERMLETVCSPGFPNAKEKDNSFYFEVKDTAKAAQSVFDSMRDKQSNDLEPRLCASYLCLRRTHQVCLWSQSRAFHFHRSKLIFSAP